MNAPRKWVWLAGTLAILLICTAVAWLVLRSPIRYENFEQIQIGMTKDEVETLLGCRAGDHSTETILVKMTIPDSSVVYRLWSFAEVQDCLAMNSTTHARWEAWYGTHGLILVQFGPDEKVLARELMPGRRMPSRWWHFIERKVGLDTTMIDVAALPQ